MSLWQRDRSSGQPAPTPEQLRVKVLTDGEEASLEKVAELRGECGRLERENRVLRGWLGIHLKYEQGAKRRLYLRPDGRSDPRHFGTTGEAIEAALRDLRADQP